MLMAGESSTAAALRVRRCRRKGLRRSPTKIKEAVLDLISSLPDDILQHILSFIQTKIAIKTSLLSKRWRHVWCGTPSLSFYCNRVEAPFINKTLTRYTSSKMMSFKLHSNLSENVPHLDSWIEFLMSRNVENLSMTLWHDEYKFPDFFYINSSVKQLFVELDCADMRIPTCSVSWTSLKKLTLRKCRLSDD
ncbi:unnamed protein product [Arabidopsis arenosa]|uniref:F-box domain-containing protein n=1 Tax=Arabidopsis arenosa TaxID=38785 RepID=A0A8S1ZVS1_ARAAE|nr:unnamed protein product [Arabidopsis arenosa]